MSKEDIIPVLTEGQLRSGDRSIELTPTEYTMLRYFALNAGRLIAKEELLDQVWPSTFVTEDLVKDYVRKLRRVLHDDPKRPRFIETVRGRGYRFVGEIEVTGVDAMVQSAVRDAVSAPSVIVLPFPDASDDGSQGHFSAGIAEDIIMQLSRFRSLVVIAFDTSSLYDGEAVSSSDAGRETRAQYVVRGRVQKAGNRVRIYVQLIETAGGACIWAERFDRALDDIFAVQDEISAAVVHHLVGRIEDSERRRAIRKQPDSLAVHDLILLGNWHFRQYTEEGVLEARRLYNRALALESSNARAHAELALNYLQEFWSDWTVDKPAAGQTGYGLAKKAVSLDEYDSRASLYLATAHFYVGREYDLAEAEFQRTYVLNPNDHDMFCLRAWLLALSGRADEGIACAAHAIRLSPLTPEGCCEAQCVAAYSTGRYAVALEALDGILEPTNDSNAYRAMCHAQLGHDPEAQRFMAEYLSTAAKEMTNYPGDDADLWRRHWATTTPFKNPSDQEHLLEGLRMAGMP